jgi:hypothetical protein
VPSDPLGLQDNPLFGGLAKAFNGLATLKGRMNGSPKPGTMSPAYASSMYAGEAANRGVAPAKSKVKPAAKGASPVKKVVKKVAKKPVVKAKAKGKTEAPGMKSKGKKADKAVEMKKFVNVKGKKK